VIGDNMTLLGSKQGGGSNFERPATAQSATPADDFKPQDNATDDLPF